MNVIYVNCGVKNYVRENHRSYLRNFCCCEKKAWKTKIQACTGFEPLTSAVQVQRPTNLANKPTRSRSLNWFVINPCKNHQNIIMDSAPRRNLFAIYSITLPEQVMKHRIDLKQQYPSNIAPLQQTAQKWDLLNSHSFMQTLTNQMSRTVSSWPLIGLKLHVRMWINQKRSHFWALLRTCTLLLYSKEPKSETSLIHILSCRH